MDYLKEYNMWLDNDYFDEETKKELREIKDNDMEIQERFYKELEFGTGGLRGIIGAGNNRMNIYTVRKATQGLANYIKINGQEAIDKGVVIAYDSRYMSPEFADEAALVLNANGIKAYVFESLRPTPELSFAVRELGAIAGIVVTASHNPAEYNGYKVYWEDGAQITSPKDVEIIGEVKKVTDYKDVKSMDKETASKEGLYNVIGKEIDDRYIEELKKQIINPDAIKKASEDFSIVYTPLHGTGNIPVRRILDEIGFKNVNVVGEQELPDSNFSTVSYPNPEDIKAFKLAIELGKEKNADVILATDPDADRLGVLVKKNDDYIALTGNMIGVLLLDYILSQKKANNKLPENGAVIETIVSTDMASVIADSYNVKLFKVLTGFKYIGEKIKEFKEEDSYEYLFGFEESYGCLIGTHARDKDAVVATMTVCELGAYYKLKGLTLYDALIEVYEKYGYYKETLESVTLKGIEGVNKIKHILSTLRNEPPKDINGIKVIEAVDYLEDTDLPKSNVLYYTLEDGSWFCVRPSGTEPKIKFYFGIKDSSNEEADKHLEKFSKGVMKIINDIIQ
ncbi:phospho-sugar mutase [Vallitalea guaymasensis]|uniref:phospho-sugar mutase n=1 Tax=Vallitalea guaymasensis TaxID=1185412 RepID=UPI000DE4ED73|nr:phospho-sugar mutase [Vallitalea guaymasensis]